MTKRHRDTDDKSDKTDQNDKTEQNINIPKIIFKKKKTKIDFLDIEIKTLDDLINLANKYNPNNEYSFNLEKLYNLLPSLNKLKNIIGMTTVKDSIVGQIIFFLNEFDNENMDMMHTVIQGPPGVGKTLLGKIIGELYYYMGIIKPKSKIVVKKRAITCEELDDELEEYMNVMRGIRGRGRTASEGDIKEPFIFRIVKRADLIGKYLGTTAGLTQKVIDETEGGVLFIDEAYSLGSADGRDSFAKECIDTLNQNLSEKKNSLLCIVAGYKDALDKCFFSQNEGLRRRFPFVYTIEKYTANELWQIFKKMVTDMGWNAEDIPEKFFEENYKLFTNMGGDIETLFFMTKIEHGKRVLLKPIERKKINIQDIENAFKIFKINKESKKSKEDIINEDETWKNLYN
jgi:SpoVK/Ycf46/Vps4 family AAA+-type ATPase